MATIRILLGIICLIAIGWSGLFGSGAVAGWAALARNREAGKDHLSPIGWKGGFAIGKAASSAQHQSPASLMAGANILAIAKAQIGIREFRGKNDGLAVEQYLAYTGNQKGDPWCAAFVSWVFGQAGFVLPRTAWSPALFPLNRRTLMVKPATVFGIYFPERKRIAHCGLVEKRLGSWVYTIEGNTNVSGGREGDGVYRKIRHHRTVAIYADWIAKVKRGGQP